MLVGTRHRLPHGLPRFDQVLTGRAHLTDRGVQVMAVFVNTEIHKLSVQPAKPFVDRCTGRRAGPSNTTSDDAVLGGRRKFGLSSVVLAHVEKDTSIP